MHACTCSYDALLGIMHREFEYLSPEKSYKAKLRMYTFLLIFVITGLVSKMNSVHNMLYNLMRGCIVYQIYIFNCCDILCVTDFGKSCICSGVTV